MKKKFHGERVVRVTCWVSEADRYELDRLAILWGLDRSDFVRVAVKKFLQDPTLDFELDTKERKEQLRVDKTKRY